MKDDKKNDNSKEAAHHAPELSNERREYVVPVKRAGDSSSDGLSVPLFTALDTSEQKKEIRKSVDVIVDGIMNRWNSGAGVGFFAFLPESGELDIQLIPVPVLQNLENLDRILRRMSKEDRESIEDCMPEPEKSAMRRLYNRIKENRLKKNETEGKHLVEKTSNEKS